MPAHNCAGIFLSLKSAPIHWQSSLHSIYGNILFCYCLMYVIINILRQSRRYYDCRPLKVAYSQMVKNTLPSIPPIKGGEAHWQFPRPLWEKGKGEG